MLLPCFRFKDALDCELITVKAFNCPYNVSSYRLAKLSEGFHKEKAAVNQRLTEQMEGLSKQNTVVDGKCLIFSALCNNFSKPFLSSSIR